MGVRRKLEIIREMRLIFSRGRDAWNRTESRVMPRNSSDVLGPAVFSAGRGTPSSWNKEVRAWRPCAGGEEGGVTVRKSSKRWMT